MLCQRKVLSLSLSLSLSLRVSTLEKESHVHSTHLIQAKVRKASVPSFFFFLWTSRSTCGSRSARWTRTVVCSNEAQGSSADWPAPADIAECRLPNSGLQSSHSWYWLIQKKKEKSSEPFLGILQCGPAFWPTTCLPC